MRVTRRALPLVGQSLGQRRFLSDYVKLEYGLRRRQAWYRLETAKGTREKIKIAWEILNDPILSPPMTKASACDQNL